LEGPGRSRTAFAWRPIEDDPAGGPTDRYALTLDRNGCWQGYGTGETTTGSRGYPAVNHSADASRFSTLSGRRENDCRFTCV
jgi:hypothetical protein